MLRRCLLLCAVLSLVIGLPASAASPPATNGFDSLLEQVLEGVEAPIARDLLPGDQVPADRNPDLPLRDPLAPSAALFAEPVAGAASTADCDYDAYPEDPDDASIKLGLVPYHDIAPRLCEIETASERVSVEVIGQSTQGRDLHLVTVTLPESAEEAARQEELHGLVTTDPEEAIARFDEIAGDYKTPMLVTNNIHGNEWEGTDASFEVIEDLAFSDDEDALALLSRARLYFVMTQNPDGRVVGTRANGAGFDMNRDFITQSQPETRAVRDVIVATTPLIMLDIHGYTIQTLVEPCTKPHNDNYEYDLYIKWALPQAEAMEDEILLQSALGGAGWPLATGVEIPYRDRDEGWDDWPPIFTPMFAMHHGAVGHTIEVPIPVNTLYSTTPSEALQEFSRQNTIVGRASIEGAFAFALNNQAEMFRDQLEIFRRGATAEDSPGRDEGGNEVWAVQTFPNAYVIPAGDRQHSATAAARLVDMLTTNDVKVERATAAFTADGTSYPAGSYVVDMRQPKRGLANAMLEPGRDISDDVTNMYDISGWSLGLLWGATVDTIDGAVEVATEPVAIAAPTGAVEAPGDAIAYTFGLDDFAGLRALHMLLDADIDVQRGGDGTLVVDVSAKPILDEVADRTGVRFSAWDSLPADRERLHRPRLAVAATAQERHALAEMDLDVTPVSTSSLDNGFSLDGYDVLVVASGLSYSGLNDDAQAEVDAFLARGGGVVGRGGTGAAFNDGADLLDVQRQSGPGGANGVVAVTNASPSPIAGSSPQDGHSFVYGPLWFTELADGVRADQRLVDGDPLVSGHWRGSGSSTKASAGGHAIVVSGTAESSSRVVLFGTEPLFRAHPKGMYLQVAEALLWTAQFPAVTAAPADPDPDTGTDTGNGTDPTNGTNGTNGTDTTDTTDGTNGTAPTEAGDDAGVSRLFGTTRFGTAAALSREGFGGGADVVYVATGLDFADALAAGPPAITEPGPILLVATDDVPQATADELQRLRPERVRVLGGPAAVSDAVLTEIGRYAGHVERWAGSTRFHTAVEVSRATFEPGSPVFVATGLAFPDALTGGVLAGRADGPVLLVQPDAIPAVVAAELERISPPSITILGGPGVVSAQVEEELAGYAPAVQRLHGANRFGTAAAVSGAQFRRGADLAYVATGASFADALAAVPVAGLRGAPILLVGTETLPQETSSELHRLEATSVVILGGEAAVTQQVEAALEQELTDA